MAAERGGPISSTETEAERAREQGGVMARGLRTGSSLPENEEDRELLSKHVDNGAFR